MVWLVENWSALMDTINLIGLGILGLLMKGRK